jgi:hypothetical protein
MAKVCLKKIDSWTPPPLNVDPSFDPNTRHAGPGFIARNYLGEVIFSGWSSDCLYYSAKEAERLAALVGIRKTLSVYKGCIWLESDCLATVQALNDSTQTATNCIVIEEAKKDVENVSALHSLKVQPECKWSGS